MIVLLEQDRPKPKGEYFQSKMSARDDDTQSIISGSSGYGSIQSSQYSHVSKTSSTASSKLIQSSNTKSVVKDIVTEDPSFPGKSKHEKFFICFVCT